MEQVESQGNAALPAVDPKVAISAVSLPAPPRRSEARRNVLMVTAAAGALGTFLPWVHVPFRGAIVGSEGDGWITFGLFLIGLLAAFSDPRGTIQRVAMGFSAVCAAAIGVHHAAKVFQIKAELAGETNEFAGGLSSAISIGVGLYLVILAGIILALGAIPRLRPPRAS